MSFKLVDRVLDHSESRHGARLVLLVLAEHANDEDVSYPAVKTMARRARLSERAVQEALRRLEDDGEIETTGKSQYGTTMYHVDPGGAESAGGAECDTGGVQNGAENSAKSAPEPTTEPTTEPPVGAGGSGRLFDSDPVAEVFDHYKATVPGKESSRLTQETRRLIKRALDERPIDKLKAAISGLAASQHHIDGGWTGIAYAIGKIKMSESMGDRIDMMAAKAPAQSADGRTTVDELLRTVPSDRHWIIRDRMSLIIQARRRGEPDEKAEEELRNYPGVEPDFDGDGKITGWRKVS